MIYLGIRRVDHHPCWIFEGNFEESQLVTKYSKKNPDGTFSVTFLLIKWNTWRKNWLHGCQTLFPLAVCYSHTINFYSQTMINKKKMSIQYTG